MVIGMIPNNEPINPVFEDSKVLKKLKLLLLILYLRDRSEAMRTNYRIDYVKLFSILSEACKEDLEVIKDDYRQICDKVMQGRAHEISEGDTRYLGACTKGSTSEKSIAPQYYGDMPAKRRAFSLKQSYMTYIINKYILNDVSTYDSIFKSWPSEAANFDDFIINKLNTYKGRTEKDLYKEFKVPDCKNANQILINNILGVKTENSEEFEKANIKIKTIRITDNGMPKESMSFPVMKIKEFVEESFYESSIYNYFADTRFLFTVFKINENKDFVFQGAMFWNMPIYELDTTGKEEWEMYREHFRRGVKFDVVTQASGKQIIKNDLKSSKETKIFHLRPHAAKSSYVINGMVYGSGRDQDMDELPNGDKMTKQCFWLNRKYIADVIKNI